MLDRNRTLSIKKLAEIQVPVPSMQSQREFKSLLDLRTRLEREAQQSTTSSTALLPSLLDRVFGDNEEGDAKVLVKKTVCGSSC